VDVKCVSKLVLPTLNIQYFDRSEIVNIVRILFQQGIVVSLSLCMWKFCGSTNIRQVVVMVT